MEFVTDRTESDVLMGNEKGLYSYTDLNRVERSVEELIALALKLDVHPKITVKTDWGVPGTFFSAEWPTESQMKRYLQNVIDLCDLLSVSHADVPDSMRKLTWQGANAIENALQAVYIRIQSVLETYRYSGEIFAEEEMFL